MTHHKHYPVGSIARDSEPPRYVPGRIYDFPPGSPAPTLDTRPLAEADTWPSVPRDPVDPHGLAPPAVVWRPSPRPRLRWRVRAWLAGSGGACGMRWTSCATAIRRAGSARRRLWWPAHSFWCALAPLAC